MGTINKRSPFAKALVVASSLLLVGGYVLYSVADTLMPGSKSGRVIRTHQEQTAAATNPTTEPTEPATKRARFFPGSKSAAVFEPTEPSEPPSADERQLRELSSPVTRPTTEPVLIQKAQPKAQP